MTDVTTEGSRLIARWLGAVRDVELAQGSLRTAENSEINAQAALAKWLMPSDMKPGEKVAVWHGDSLFQVELAPRESFSPQSGEAHIEYVPKVTIRTRGKHFHDIP